MCKPELLDQAAALFRRAGSTGFYRTVAGDDTRDALTVADGP
jgi:hypothetical protein